MKLGQAAAYHATTPMLGWDGTQWKSYSIKGDFHTFDRFITERSFGLKKRILTTSKKVPAEVTALQDPSGRRYLITSENPDFHGSDNYMNSYLLLQADFSFDVINMVKQLNVAGTPIGSTKQVTATFFGDMERYTGETSRLADHARYSVMNIQLPVSAATHVNIDSLLSADGDEYEVKEVNKMLKILVVIAVKREG